MRLGIAIVALWILLGPCSIAGQEKMTSSPQERIFGGWVNTDRDARGLKRLEVARKDNTWSIEAWALSGGGTVEISWGKTNLDLLGDSVRSKDLPYGLAIWSREPSVTYLTVRLDKEELIVETFVVFKDTSGRSNYRRADRFKKK